MKQKLYSIYDKKALTFNVPYAAVTDGVAIRMFTQIAQDESTSVGQHPEDYQLNYVGEFDQELGVVEPAKAIKCLMQGDQVDGA